ncbi:MAG TPA: hypothetical protein VN038_01510 [Dyadobacter sp.]|nr:hypothetical protein [Dyadobacter sp.]
MTTQPNTDRKLSAYFITTALVLGFTVLPWYSEIVDSLKGDKEQVEIVEEPVHYTDTSHACIETHNVVEFSVFEIAPETFEIWMGGRIVETDLDNQTQAELFYTKEEINVRVDGNRLSIIAGDNGQF